MSRVERLLAALALGFLAGLVAYGFLVGESRARAWRVVNQESIR